MACPDGESRSIFPWPAARAQLCDGLFRLKWRTSAGNPKERQFDSADAAFYFAQGVPALGFVELWKEGLPICELRKIVLRSGSLWQIVPIKRSAGPAVARAGHSATGQAPRAPLRSGRIDDETNVEKVI